MHRVFEEDIVRKAEGQKENELAFDATIRFELDDCFYTVKVNDRNELEIHKIATTTNQDDEIKLRAPSCNAFCLG